MDPNKAKNHGKIDQFGYFIRRNWDAIVRKYNLQAIPYEQIASWAFGDFIFNSEFDNITSTIKARRACFHDCIDTEDMFTNFFADLRERRILPPLS
ncbi:hypothetical protein [Edaphobacter modestus]|uniref:hypothetical protein n=1 Tax=Edaphobacter modestus TaxID=388466 RepID=UPI001A91B0A4|nr:hypothetical protein [Edaphobacter modestus]